MNSQLLYYEALTEFKNQYYKDLLTHEHLVSGEVHISSLTFPDGGQDTDANFWGYILEKDGKKYLLPSKVKRNGGYESVDIKDVLPFYANGLQKTASKGVVYLLVSNPISAKFRVERRMNFRELVDSLSCLGHSSPMDQKLLWLLGMTSVLDRFYFRLSSPPSSGKDSVVDTLGNLIGECASIVNPTIAKLEYRTTFKWLVVNEIVDISKAEWRNIQQFLLDSGAHKPVVEKHSRASSGTKESLDISNFSLSLFFNDIDCYPEPLEYFDFVTKAAVKDRFPAFRLKGVLTEDFNSIKNVDVARLVSDNMDYYKDLIYTISFYKQKDNVLRELKGFTVGDLVSMPERWRTSIGRLLKLVDLYCDSQEEFDKFIKLINSSINDYKVMLEYPKVYEKFVKRFPVGSDAYRQVMVKFRLSGSWADKLALLRSGSVVVEDKSLW